MRLLPRAASLGSHLFGTHNLQHTKRGTSALVFIGIKYTLFFQNVEYSIILRNVLYAHSSVRGIKSIYDICLIAQDMVAVTKRPVGAMLTLLSLSTGSKLAS